MKRLLLLGMVLTAPFLFISRTHALVGASIDPFIAYTTGKDTKTNNTSKSKYSGFLYGVKAAANITMWRGGLLFEGNSLTVDSDDQTHIEKMGGTSFGLFGGIKPLPMLHVDFHYYLSSSLKGDKFKEPQATEVSNLLGEVTLDKGSGIGIEVGTNILPYLNVHAYYRSFTYSESKSNQGTQEFDHVIRLMGIGVAFPFSIL